MIRHRNGDGDGIDFFQIHEVYYDEGGTPKSITEDAVGVGGNTKKEIADVLDMMRKALEKPVLDFEKIVTIQLEYKGYKGAI